MAQWEPPPTTLTHFGPLSSEESPGGGLFSRLWRRNKDDSGASPKSGSKQTSRDGSVDREAPPLPRSGSLLSTTSSSSDKKEEEKENIPRIREEKTVTDQTTARTLSGVLNRLSNILDSRTATPQAYKDSDFKQFWMPDSSCRECYDCGDKFTTFRRRHHCRICGQIFCSKCCNQELPGRIIGYKGGIRVCTYCGKVAMSALQAEPEGKLHVEREDLGLSFDSDSGIWGIKNPDMGRNIMTSSTNSNEAAPFDVTPQSDYSCSEHFNTIDRKILEDSAQLRELWRQIVDPERGVEMQNHRIRLRTYNRCVPGNKLVDWLIRNDKANQRLQATAIGQALLDAGYLETVAGQPMLFHDDFTLYKPSETSPVDDPQSDTTGGSNSNHHSTEPEWFKEIETDDEMDDYSASEDHAVRSDLIKSKSEHSFGMSTSTGSKVSQKIDDPDFEPLPRQDLAPAGIQEDIISDSMFTSSQTIPAVKLTTMNRGWRYAEAMKEENGEKKAYTRIRAAFDDHLRSLANQLLSEACLSKSWMDIVLGTAERISFYVHPDIKGDNDHMDIRRYVKFKKIPGGVKEQTCLVHGLVFTKNIAHKKMSHHITNPYILLLKGSIEYQRVANKFSSLEPQILQEEEFLQKNIAKISSLKPKPHIVVVEKTVSRLAQNYLLKEGITLIYNVKMVTMEKLERFTQASIVSSIDGVRSGPITLGFCHNFKVYNFQIPEGETKTMLCFDGCATHLGCTVNLRGGSLSELKRLKSVMKTMVYAAYHAQLEISFLMDEFALPVNNQEEPLSEDSEEGPVIKPNPKNLGMVYQNWDLTASSQDLDSTMMSTIESGLDIARFCRENAAEKESIPGPSEPSSKKSSDEDLQVLDDIARGTAVQRLLDEETESKSVTFSTDDDDDIPGDKKEVQHMDAENSAMKIDESESTVLLTSNKSLQMEKSSSDNISVTSLEEKLAMKNSVAGNETTESVQSSDKDLYSSSENEVRGETTKKQSTKSKGHSTKHSSTTKIEDQSDPLYNYQKNQDDTIFFSSQRMEEKTQKQCQKFRKLLNEVILSTSPYVQHSLPYLLSKEGTNCRNRRFFPDEMYWSEQFENQTFQQKKKQRMEESSVVKKVQLTWSDVEVANAHPLMTQQLILPVMDKKIQGMLADFRARGGCVKLTLAEGNGISRSDVQDRHKKPSVSKRKSGETEPSHVKSPKRRDCFDFVPHQRLAVLLSSHSQKSANHPYPCLPPQVVTMEFYGSQDITLGGFLEKFCFRESYSCQPYSCPSAACDIPMLDHVRRIVHGNGAIYISLRRLTNVVPGGEKSIMMWNWCRKCRQATPLVPMSMDSWNMSFAKYLELRFYGNCFVRRVGSDPCTHSLHQFYSQYFGFRNIVATFKYYAVSKKEVALPPSVISLEEKMQKSHFFRLKEEVRSITKRNTEMYSLVLETIMGTVAESQPESLTKLTTDYKAIIPTEKSRMRDLADVINQKLQTIWLDVETNPDKDHSDKTTELYLIQDDLVKMKRLAADAIVNWNTRLQEMYAQQKKYKVQAVKKEKESNGSQPSQNEEDSKSITSTDSPSFIIGEEMSSFHSLHFEGENVEPHLSGGGTSDSVQVTVKEETYRAYTESNAYSVTPGLEAGIGQDDFGSAINSLPVSYSNYVLLSLAQASPGSFENNAEKVDSVALQKEMVSMATKETESDGPAGDGVVIRPKQPAIKPAPQRISVLSSNVKKSASGEDLLDSQQPDRISGIKKTLSNFWSGSGSTLTLPFDASEHHQLPVGKVPVLVYDHETSSIIAYALSCHDYHTKLQEIQAHGNQKEPSGHSSGKGGKEMDTGEEQIDQGKKSSMLSFLRGTVPKETSPKLPRKLESVDSVKYIPAMDSDSIEIDDENNFSILSTGVSESEKSNKSGKPSTSPHIELQFSDQTARFYCKVYFAEQFRQLRKLLFPAGEEMYIRSLSRCKLWEAKGGKSGSAFCKTDDNRFILKQMSSIEVDIFEKFGPEYFKYVSGCFSDQKPTALAKIVGVYKIGFRNTTTNNAMKQDLLVMENLFYNRKISQTFDLKGSMRNRLVNTSGKREDELVLLDENLLKLSVDSPLYIYPHSKAVLISAINRDSEFLSSNLVMDYSLLVGFDQTQKELVVGIIDYIRTFTWDKKLETLFKSTGGKMPTVVSPEIYRNRFLEAINMQYFLPVPDQWAGLGSTEY